MDTATLIKTKKFRPIWIISETKYLTIKPIQTKKLCNCNQLIQKLVRQKNLIKNTFTVQSLYDWYGVNDGVTFVSLSTNFHHSPEKHIRNCFDSSYISFKVERKQFITRKKAELPKQIFPPSETRHGKFSLEWGHFAKHQFFAKKKTSFQRD